MDNVYLYHYMEIYGLIGESTDIGAATVCGSLRFDDGETIHRVKGRREFPRKFSDATYIGDFCRTGVNVIIMPGCKVGPYSILGAGVILEEDVPSRTSIRVKQTLEKHSWGPEKYGW
jgi:bifunctional UDP-N-acetylglucosamine pyrophosphorylase/glucosamine-1-phosphate N-acetyltransferase